MSDVSGQRKKAKRQSDRVLVVGSINVDLYQRMSQGSVVLGGKTIDVTSIKGQTLPAKSFVQKAPITSQLSSAEIRCVEGEEEHLVLSMAGPFEQKTGGKGANAAAAAGQTWGCEFIGNMGEASAEENVALLSDLQKYGSVETGRCDVLSGPTGTAYILLFDDGDNAILLIGGANQLWPTEGALMSGDEGTKLRDAISESVALMLQREIPEYVNVCVARHAQRLGVPVFVDVGGTDAPLDSALIPYVSVIAPNESELTFISGVETSVNNHASKSLVRKAVAALKSKFATRGQSDVEVLVTLGPLGSMYFGNGWVNDEEENGDGLLPQEVRMGCFQIAGGKPKDTTGAGDCFRGSFVAARYGEGKTVEQAMRWGAAAASLAIEVEGAMPSMPPRESIDTRVNEQLIYADFQ
eukprot:CAMPEP_0119342720 /NCGR_PEP_ID=MMETSP1333-20130426/105292_1 /TAXON_ID=418940 /ORGANISM="Scyphosphaera apsteinii, Strain RCC1455" /LENGTH=409 /DNA_ID=CAMNT_0007355001 /DNA_START=82 /DNA_END=1311 /DNA_ORIENTATION=-